MSNVAIFKPGKPAQYLKSVNTPDYSSDPDVLVNPDISSVADLPTRYWKPNAAGTGVKSMTIAEKQAVDDAEEAKRLAQADTFNIDVVHLAKALVAVGVVTKNNLISELKTVIQNE